jgi:hypothetical protein
MLHAAVVEVSTRSIRTSSTTSTRHHTDAQMGKGGLVQASADQAAPRDPVLPYYWVLDGTYFVLLLLSYGLIDEQSPVADSNTVWSLGVLLLLGLRNRSARVVVSAAIDISFMLVFIALTWATGPSTRLRKDLLAMTLPLVASFGMAAFRFAADLASRRRYLSDTKLTALQQEMQQDATQLAHLLRQMVPDQTTDNGRLFAKLVDAVRCQPAAGAASEGVEESAAASVARRTLTRLPRLFGIRASLFASATVDRAFLLAQCCPPMQGRLRNEHGRTAWLQAVGDALGDVPQVKLVKSDGEFSMFVDEHRLLDESCLSLLSFTAALQLRLAAGPAATDDSHVAMRYALVAGPVMAGVLGTAALSFEYYGEPIETGRRLLGSEGDLLWTPVGGALRLPLPALPLVVTSRFTDWLQWGLVLDAANREVGDASNASSSAMASSLQVVSILDRMMAISSATFDNGAPFNVSCERVKAMAEYRLSRWCLGAKPTSCVATPSRGVQAAKDTTRYRRRSPGDADLPRPSPRVTMPALSDISASRLSVLLPPDVSAPTSITAAFHKCGVVCVGGSKGASSVRVALRTVVLDSGS